MYVVDVPNFQILNSVRFLNNYENNHHHIYVFFSSFTVVRSSQPVTVRAEYGPFESSHMVPTQYLVPDLLEEPNVLDDSTDLGSKKKAALITDFKPHQLDLSAHLVTNEVIIKKSVWVEICFRIPPTLEDFFFEFSFMRS